MFCFSVALCSFQFPFSFPSPHPQLCTVSSASGGHKATMPSGLASILFISFWLGQLQMKQPPFQKRHSQYKAACRTSSKEKVKETQNAKEAYRKSLSNYKSQPEFILDHCSYLVSDFPPCSDSETQDLSSS